MRIYLQELSDEPKELHFSEADAWLKEVVLSTEESPPSKKPKYSVDLSLRRNSDVVFLKGKFDLEVGLLCSRCADQVDAHLKSQFEALFTKEADLGSAPTKSGAQSGTAYSEPTDEDGTGLEIEVLEKDYIELGDVIKEQVYLQIPVQPLCREDCKGICATCGQNQNTEPCQCHRIRNSALAQGLRKLKLK